ncbi:MAG TPA: hypothetical protein DIU15_20880 [Deltaproteobacteria bacterium]|nr:hypothetical protein [Deltaproteobacteria bacterium]HCP48505.1 hypothetical protein [Deltaproteobacteria bacterium]
MRHTATLCLWFTLLVCSSCAPNRDTGDEGDDDGSLPGTQLQTALFSEPRADDDLQYAHVSLIDDDWICEMLDWDGSLEKWLLGPEVDYVTLSLFRGASLEGWLGEYQPISHWKDDCAIDGDCDLSAASLFEGEVGTSDDIRDDEVPVDEPVGAGGSSGSEGREVTGQLAANPKDRLIITGYSDTLVSGYVQSEAGDYAFEASRCAANDTLVPPGEGVDTPATD